ncbi:hypothetical protein ERJ70_07020 [Sediminibacillus dalangtanensis]|uniref:Uncharacterized protein n=1 Tax=Sediminibacillus dalangtanensis TaxID=2729421 RepID=A0ABX7VQD2_9BACI|nr:hypothetical protein [Sediminibacillus dalangtanensis]QTM99074.1 hypothetical protein ERJ70_07020 [Sediminibacillus dalangtanensis]
MKLNILFGFLVFAGIFAVYDALRKINNNLLDQTEEIKNLLDEIKKINK